MKSERSKIWIEKTLKKLLEHTGGKITRESLLRFQSWYMRNFGYESQKKFYDNTRAFLEYLYKETGDLTFRELKEVLDRPQRQSKKLNKIIIRPVDVENVIKGIYNTPKSPYDPPWKYAYFRIKHIANTLFLAYTGQRPQSTTDRLTFEDFEKALKRNPPMLWIPEEKDKESFPHWVPLHPVVVEWIKPVIEFRHLINAKDSVPVFPYNSLRIVLIDLDIKAHHTGMRIQPSHFRKFFEQMCNNVLMVHPGLRDYIMAHNTGSLDVQSYDGKLPSEIYRQYMEKWGKVNLVPPGVKLEKLVSMLPHTGD
ncbi:hypothetical protein [Geoglobus acetivorans]|uniref:hypothetical protein n=1 Tax=Geoglobus acetivorans TaxID=565033 RepID=UPI00064ECCE5